MAAKNPKHLDDIDIVDLIWHKDQARYWELADEHRIKAPRKKLIQVYKEVYNVC